MSAQVFHFEEPPISIRKIFRYANCAETEEIKSLIWELIEEVREKIVYRVCAKTLACTVEKNVCMFENFSVSSDGLARFLHESKHTLLFAATIGIEFDRLLVKYSRLSPTKALLLQAIGTERVESLCDMFCEKYAKGKARFSPGYGDLALSVQQQVFAELDCTHNIGIYLSDAFIMRPSKSVTAFVGL